MDHSGTYDLVPEVKDHIKRLFVSRYGSNPHLLENNPINLIALYQTIQYIWHTIYDDSPIDPTDEEILRTEETKIRYLGDATVRGWLCANIAHEEHIMYMLVRNIRAKVLLPGLDNEEWVLFNATSTEEGIQLLFQRSDSRLEDLLAEDVSWRCVPGYLSTLLFQLDGSEEFGTLEQQLGFDSVIARSKMVRVCEGMDSFSRFWTKN